MAVTNCRLGFDEVENIRRAKKENYGELSKYLIYYRTILSYICKWFAKEAIQNLPKVIKT